MFSVLSDSVIRFLTRDPYPAYASVPSTLHRYAYVGNNPINRVDPSGLRWAAPKAHQLRLNPLEMAGLSQVRAMNAGARAAGRIGGPARAASLSYRPGSMAAGGGVSRAGFGGYRTSGARMFPKPNAPPYDATRAARRYRDAANAITSDAQRRGLGKRPSDCALDWYAAQREKQAVADAIADEYGSMSAAERKAARQKLQEQYQKLDQQWGQHVARKKGFFAGLLDALKPGEIVPYLWQQAKKVKGGPLPRTPEELFQRIGREWDASEPGMMLATILHPSHDPYIAPFISRAIGHLVKEATDHLEGQWAWLRERSIPGLEDQTVGGAIDAAVEFAEPYADRAVEAARRAAREVWEWLHTPEGATVALILAGAITVGGVALGIATFGVGPVLVATGTGMLFGAVSGGVGQLVEDVARGEWSSSETYARQIGLGMLGGGVAGAVGLGATALGPIAGGLLSGLSVGAIQQTASNLVEGKDWYEGVGPSAALGMISGGVAAGAVAGINPQGLPARVLAGGLVGGGVSGGMHVALNVASGRRWHEGLGQAVAVGATTGAVDAFADFYGDKVMDRVMTPRPRARTVDTDTDGVRARGAVDAQKGSPLHPGDVDDAFRRMSNVEVRDEAVALLRRKVDYLEGTGRRPDLAKQGRLLIDQIDTGEVDVLVKGDRDFQRHFKRWFGESGDDTTGTVNLDTGQILIKRSQVGSVEEVMLTAFHEGMHYQDYDNVLTLAREMYAFGRTAEFAEVVGLKYNALGQEDLGAFLHEQGISALEGLVMRDYMLRGDEHRPGKYAAIRSGRFEEAIHEWFMKDKLPNLAKQEQLLHKSFRDMPEMLVSNLRDPALIWQYARHTSGEDIPYDPVHFEEMVQDPNKLKTYLDSLPGWRYLGQRP